MIGRAVRIALGILSLALVTFAASPAKADFFAGDFNGDSLIQRQFTVAANQWLTVQTTGCSGSADTVVFVVTGDKYTSGHRTTAAYNDDDGFSGTFCSYTLLQNTTGSSQTYTVVVTTYNQNTPADVTLLTQVTPNSPSSESIHVSGFPKRFGGNGSAETLQVVPTRGAYGGHFVDTILYVIDPTVGGPANFDDDSGFALLSETQNIDCTNKTCWVVVGLYGGGTGGGNLDVWSQGSSGDTDHDGISDSLEDTLTSFGRLPANAKLTADSDGDGLSDFVELVGVPSPSGLAGFDSSLAMPWQGSIGGPDATQQDLFVQVDYMAATGHTHNPLATNNWTTIVSDLTATFTNDSGFSGRGIRMQVDVRNSLTETTDLGFEPSCPGLGAAYSPFYTFKSNSSYFDPLKATIYHYVIFGHQLASGCSDQGGTSGRSEELGSDSIISLGAWAGSVGTVANQHGTFSHEFGHELGLNHFGNGNNNGNNSCVHSSPMNYRYQMPGWGDGTITTNRRYSYSRGACDAVGLSCANTCTSLCVPTSQNSPKQGCSPNKASCDCDRNEWNLVTTAFPYESDELTTYHYCQLSPGQCDGVGGVGGAPASWAHEVEPYFLGDVGHMDARHHDFGQRRKQRLKDHGLVEGVDFVFDPVLARAFAVE
jgi:hypothetical protein